MIKKIKPVGRPQLAKKKRLKISVSIDPTLLAKVKKYGQVSAFINEAVADLIAKKAS
jgi:hypothetical protein